MQAYEFRTTARDGVIRIPDEYVDKAVSEVRVVLFVEDSPKIARPPKRSLMDLAGILKGCPDMDVKEIRAERRKKYENPD